MRPASCMEPLQREGSFCALFYGSIDLVRSVLWQNLFDFLSRCAKVT